MRKKYPIKMVEFANTSERIFFIRDLVEKLKQDGYFILDNNIPASVSTRLYYNAKKMGHKGVHRRVVSNGTKLAVWLDGDIPAAIPN